MITDIEKFFSELAIIGESNVRTRLAQGIYGQNKIPLIHEWLRKEEEKRINLATSRAESAASRAEVATLEQLRIARSAKNAAWIAAIVAIIGITISIILNIWYPPK